MKKHTVFPLFLAACLVLSACAKNTGENYTTYYPECQQPILEMQSQETPLMGAAKGTIGGGLIGGVSGFLLGLLFSGGNVSDAGIGAAVGAASGAISGGISGGFQLKNRQCPGKYASCQYYDKIDGDVSGLTVRQAAEQWHCSATRKSLPRLKPGRKPASFRRLRPISAFLIFRAASSRQGSLLGSEQIAARNPSRCATFSPNESGPVKKIDIRTQIFTALRRLRTVLFLQHNMQSCKLHR